MYYKQSVLIWVVAMWPCVPAISALSGPYSGHASASSVEITRAGKRFTGPAGHRGTLLKYGRYVAPELHTAAEDPSILIDGYKNACSSIELADLAKLSGSTRGSSGSAHTYPGGNYEAFYAPLTVGKTRMNLLIDTGSSDLWVYSDHLPKNETKGHTLYKTTGAELKGYSWKINYGDGTGAAGIVYRDSVKVGKATITSQAIEAATSISGTHVVSKAEDGILGLAFEKLNSVKPKKQAPLWQLLDSVFAVDLNFYSPGFLDFGYVNESRFKAPITYVGVPSERFWYFNFTEYELNGKTFPVHHYKHLAAGNIDTGTAFTLVAAANKYYGAVKGAKKVGDSWLFPCSSKLPNLGLRIGGKFFYIYGINCKQPLGEGICYGGIQGGETPNDPLSKDDGGDIIGDPFIAGNYIVFDGSRKRIGFADKRRDAAA